MKPLLFGLLVLLTVVFNTGCSVSKMHPALHDFGLPVSVLNHKNNQANESAITVDAPTWLWDNRLRYRLLYASPTQVGFYALDLWIASPPELFEQLLIASGKTQNHPLIIRLTDFEQQFDAPDKARVVLHFIVEAYANDDKKKIGTQAFYLEQSTPTADAAGAVNGFSMLTRQAANKIQVWLAGLPDK
ncbi:MAG: hypothetical protein QX196_15085 [Methylococcaceae bacterium]|jgi:cholesterol transport system auxiliary component